MGGIVRDPAQWARQWGWVSGTRAERAATRLDDLEQRILGALDGDEGAEAWAQELRSVAAYLRKDTYRSSKR